MRTTLTLDEDVAAVIERLRKDRDASLRDIVNEALREGLRHITAPRHRPARFRTQAADLGRCLLTNVDNVAETLAVAEGESFR
jgi:adenine-specific DNA glycosylase